MTQIPQCHDTHDGFLRDKRYLIMDRDTKYSDAFRGAITRAGTDVVRCRQVAEFERFGGKDSSAQSKRNVWNRMIFVGQASLRHAIQNI